MQPNARYDLFISYAEPDEQWVHGYFLPALGLPAERVITSQNFQLGAPVVTEFERAVKTSRYTVLILSPAFLGDQWATFSESLVAYAGVADGSERLIPLALHPCALPLRIDFRVRLDCSDERNWPVEIARLRQLLSLPEHPVAEIPCPYPGMVPFQANNACYFYGRQTEICDLLLHLRHQRYMFVIGPSGSGKSSLLYAGLIPRLRQGELFPRGFWLIRAMRPGDQRMQNLLREIGSEPTRAGRVIANLLAAHAPAERLLLLIDQFEELFTQVDRSEQNRFIAALQVLRTVDTCTLLIAMRADFYPELMHSDLWPVDATQRLEIAPLRGAALREAIVQPAADVQVYLDPALLERLLDDAASEPGILPLLQETMRLLWNNRQRRLLTLSAYEQLGHDGCSGLATAVATLANSTLADLTPAQQEIARRIFLCLVQLGEGAPDTRRQQPLSELESPSDDPGDFQHTLDHLTHNGLITRGGGEGGDEPRADLAHEVLITGWPRLRAWVDEDRAGLLLHRHLAQTVDEWTAGQRDQSFLYGGARLNEVQSYASQHPRDLSQDESDFLVACAAREATRMRARYLGQATGGAFGAAFGYASAFTIALLSNQSSGDVALLNVMFMFPIGQVVGFGIGLALWLFQNNRTMRVLFAGLFGAIASCMAFLAFLALFLGNPIEWIHVAAGSILGTGVGVGAALSKPKTTYLIGSTIGGLLATLLAVMVGVLPWSMVVAVAAGAMLGACTGLGFQVTAVENNERLLL